MGQSKVVNSRARTSQHIVSKAPKTPPTRLSYQPNSGEATDPLPKKYNCAREMHLLRKELEFKI